MMAAVAAFFELPLQEKKKYAKAANEIQGYGQNFVVSEQQKLDWSDMIYLITVPPENRNYKFWALTSPVEEHSTEVQKAAEEIYANFSLLMGMDRDGLKKLLGELKQGIRMNYYPACSRPNLVLGISPRTDGSLLFTLLLQDDEITGLQIKHKESWIAVKPIPNSLVVNIGDATDVAIVFKTSVLNCLTILGNGKYKRIEQLRTQPLDGNMVIIRRNRLENEPRV
ncbi:hypothetical protein CRYUN_Cryun05aG0159100 [Craigia yunnanensis]